MEIKKTKLSASRIKTLSDCSYKYFCTYSLKLPKTGNNGSNRGTCAHTILECLLEPSRKKYVNKILKKGLESVPSVYRLALILAKKYGVADEVNFKMIKDMLLVALSNNFYCKGSIKLENEWEFTIEEDSYIIGGFIDKKAIYEDNIEVYDYKSSKAKFQKAELDENLQKFMYSLAVYKKYGKIPSIKFVFLRFPKAPIQDAGNCTIEQLEGFEQYLSYITQYLSDFDEKKAEVNLAANDPSKKWLCGFAQYPGQLKKDGTPMFYCEFKFSFMYFALVDENNKTIKTAHTKEELTLPDEKHKIKKMLYNGCPRFNR